MAGLYVKDHDRGFGLVMSAVWVCPAAGRRAEALRISTFSVKACLLRPILGIFSPLFGCPKIRLRANTPWVTLARRTRQSCNRKRSAPPPHPFFSARSVPHSIDRSIDQGTEHDKINRVSCVHYRDNKPSDCACVLLSS